MSKHYNRTDFATEQAALAEIVLAPAEAPRTGHAFDLPPALHLATVGGIFAYLGIMWAAFGEAALGISFVIFAVTIAAAFVVPGLWARVDVRDTRADTWGRFLRDGFECATGHLSARETIAQVLIMPAMLLLWGISIAVVRALI